MWVGADLGGPERRGPDMRIINFVRYTGAPSSTVYVVPCGFIL
jgi:hypothetical protein